MLNQVAISGHIAVYEIGGRFYPVLLNVHMGKVFSLPVDSTPGTGKWYGRISEDGIRYVSVSRNRSAAMRVFNKYVKQGKEFVGSGNPFLAVSPAK